MNVRTRFPYLERCVYLNTAAAGVSWTGQGEAAAAFYENAKSRGYNGMAEWRSNGIASARRSLACLLSVTEEEIGFTGSTTEGLNLAMNAVRWLDGDEIVLAADEFPSVVLACEGPRQRGARVRSVPIPSETDREAALIDALGDSTRVLAVSHVHWCTGTRVDLERLSAACTAHETLLIVDGAQAIGAVAPNLGSTAVYSASVFKWLLSGFGLAVLVVRADAASELSPMVRGYNNAPPSTDLSYSHVNHPGLYALTATLEFLDREVGWSAVYEQVHSLADDLITRLDERGLQVVTPRDAHAGIVSCSVDDADGLRDALAAQAVYVEARSGLLRASPHFYNTHQELSTYVDALSVLIPAVERRR